MTRQALGFVAGIGRLLGVLILLTVSPATALDRPNVTFKIFQFPPNMIPRVDGETNDWAMVPEDYAIGTDQFWEDSGKHSQSNPTNLDVRVRVGWVKGLNRLYFLYEAYDNYWDFALPGLHNDTFEIVVDGDASGGPLIDKGHREFWIPSRVGAARGAADDRISVAEAHWAIHGVHAQNYHIFTPAKDKDWTMAWGSGTWIKELPYANAVSA
ncbi:MAG: PKD domain containing protein, partial [Akkermansiaceae bacterium]|nr:PKD domain containing protein [Verrucomicrobiales bacterium]